MTRKGKGSLTVCLFTLAVCGEAALAQSIRQTSEAIDIATRTAAPGGAVLTRSAAELSARLSTMHLDRKAAYSIWWVVFNEPEDCLTPYVCGPPDIMAGGAFNEAQIQAAKISVFYADGFVTGTDGTAYATAQLAAGDLPAGTFVLFGWGAGFGAPHGLEAGNGLHAEAHLVIRTHGPAVAGSVGNQTSTFDGLCDIQDCTDQQAIVFRSPDAP